MHIAVVGCSHGEVDKIYEVIESIEKKSSIKIEIVLCCGDFQSVRNMTDLRCMACPIKYQAMHDFYRYYSGEKKAPKVTVFIGGNHEASNFLQELPYGGWVAPNIFYSGYTNVLKFGPLRIAGLSGIFKGRDYIRGRYEAPPYDGNTMRSVYHYRNLDIFRLKQVKSRVDIMLSHDWPQGIHSYGNTKQLLRKKPFFREEIERNELGCRPLAELLQELEPRYWFAAHLHVKFPAVVPQSEKKKEAAAAKSQTDAPETSGEKPDDLVEESEKCTHFLALDKVLPGRPFLQIIEIPNTGERPAEGYKLEYDPEWLTILKSTDSLLTAKNTLCYMPNETGNERYNYSPTQEELAEVKELFKDGFIIPENFQPTAPSFVEGERPQRAFPIVNPQTTLLCDKLGIRDPVRLVSEMRSPDASQQGDEVPELDISLNETTQLTLNPDEISLDDEDEDDDNEPDVDSRKVDSSSGNEMPLRKLSKLSLPPPKSEEGGGEGEGPLDLQEEVDTSGTRKSAGFSTELDILRSVMGSTEEEDASAGELQRTQAGISFTLDCVGEPEMKRRRNQSFYEQLENE